METYEKLLKCLAAVREKTDFVPQVALVLGTGLGDFVSQVEIHSTVSYNEIEGFPVSTVSGHAGRFVFGYVEGVPVVVMQGRVHYYEGYPIQDVVLPIRLMGLLGARALFLTNAAGGVNFDFSAGDLMLISDHISLFVPSPLIGANIDALGTRFPDMTNAYDAELREIIRKTAVDKGVALQEGVYVQCSGPQFESPAEIKFCRTIGADAVGMSTVCEAIAANHMGLRVCGVSLISNLAAGMSGTALFHGEVQETAQRVADKFTSLVKSSIAAIGAAL